MDAGNCENRELRAALRKLAGIDRTREAFHVPGRSLHAPSFATPDRRARLQPAALPPAAPPRARCG